MQLISTELGESGAKNGHFPLFEWFIFGATTQQLRRSTWRRASAINSERSALLNPFPA